MRIIEQKKGKKYILLSTSKTIGATKSIVKENDIKILFRNSLKFLTSKKIIGSKEITT